MDNRECIASEDLSAAAAPYEEDTALDREEKKKLRRVSFADELTSVHIFQRDDEGSDQTPTDGDSKPISSPPPKTQVNEDENDDEQRKFVLDFPSSPGTDFGSASTSSNDDDDGEGWFGQASASFIRGQLSAFAASDDNNYETTLDSTEFKLHFQNHNQSDSEANFKTPTRSHLSLEWRTPSTRDLTGTDSTGNLMFGVDKPTPVASISGGKCSGSGSVDDMSLIGENTRIFDYGILSHTLEAKMDESRNFLFDTSVSDHVKIPKPSSLEGVNNGLKTHDELKFQLTGLKDTGSNEPGSSYPQDPPCRVDSDVNHKGTDGFEATIIQSPRLQVEGRMYGDSLNDTRCTPEIGLKTNPSPKSPTKGSVSLSSAKRQKMFHSTSSAGQQPNSRLNNGSMDTSTISSMDCSSQRVNIGRISEAGRTSAKTTGDNMIHENVSLAGSGEELVSGFQEDKEFGATTGMITDAEGSSPRTPRIIRSSRENEDIVQNGVLKDRISAGISFSGSVMQMDFITTKAFVTPSRVLSPLNSQWGSPDSSFFSRTDPARLTGRVFEKVSSYGPAFTCERKRTATSTKLEKRLMEWLPEGPSTKETNIFSEIIGGNEVSSFPNLLKSFSVQEAENSRQKRQPERTNFVDKENIETVRPQSSPKVAPELEDMIFSSNRCIGKNSDSKMDGDNALPRDRDHKYSEFSEAMRQQMLPLAENLNLRQVSDLEDILGRLEKANKYRVICRQIQSEELHHYDVNLQRNRAAEARRLQQMLVYKEAKLQLLHLRQEKLLKKYKLLQSGIQETELLSESIANHCTPGVRGVQPKISHGTSLLVDQNSKIREEHQNVAAKRQELGSLTNKVKELTQSLIFSCKIKGEPSSTDVVVLVKEQLKKITEYRFIHQHLQLWKVVDIERKNSEYDVKLNYLDFLHQRLTITVGPVSIIITTNKLIEANIKKSYPMINACIAFAYVFNAESSRNLGSSKNLALETHLTSLRLGNLLDVVEEAHMVKIELCNLIKTSFNSPSADQLDLQLQFIDCKTGHGVTLTLDMSCLKQGIYPMEILPSQVQSQSPVSRLRSAEILSAVRALKPGHSRILELSKCVSQHEHDAECLYHSILRRIF